MIDYMVCKLYYLHFTGSSELKQDAKVLLDHTVRHWQDHIRAGTLD